MLYHHSLIIILSSISFGSLIHAADLPTLPDDKSNNKDQNLVFVILHQYSCQSKPHQDKNDDNLELHSPSSFDVRYNLHRFKNRYAQQSKL
jgi:hypothetical protein